jgi:hypothetical protein
VDDHAARIAVYVDGHVEILPDIQSVISGLERKGKGVKGVITRWIPRRAQRQCLAAKADGCQCHRHHRIGRNGCGGPLGCPMMHHDICAQQGAGAALLRTKNGLVQVMRLSAAIEAKLE